MSYSIGRPSGAINWSRMDPSQMQLLSANKVSNEAVSTIPTPHNDTPSRHDGRWNICDLYGVYYDLAMPCYIKFEGCMISNCDSCIGYVNSREETLAPVLDAIGVFDVANVICEYACEY